MFLLLAISAANLDALDAAVERCDKATINPIFAGVSAQRSKFMTDVFREQEAIVAERLDVANRRRELREAGTSSVKDGDSEAALSLTAQAIEDRQRALNDRRMLEGLRNEALDAKRRYYLAHCANGKN
jgi:hypothetical protein